MVPRALLDFNAFVSLRNGTLYTFVNVKTLKNRGSWHHVPAVQEMNRAWTQVGLRPRSVGYIDRCLHGGGVPLVLLSSAVDCPSGFAPLVEPGRCSMLQCIEEH